MGAMMMIQILIISNHMTYQYHHDNFDHHVHHGDESGFAGNWDGMSTVGAWHKGRRVTAHI